MKIFIDTIKFLGIFFISINFISCSKPGSDNPEEPDIPSNIIVEIKKQGESVSYPDGDGSGVVNIKISASNADLYKILIGNQTYESTSGNFSYTFKELGTNTYIVYISAYKGTKFISKTESVKVYVESNLVWSDEFDTNGSPDCSKWGYDIGAGGWGNNELQYYTDRPENVIVEGGYLKIKTIKESFSGSAYTSARILTKGKYSFKYGKIEFRAKLPVGGGTWPALWMLGSNFTTVGWPACGEIDVMEHVYNQLNVIHGALHHPGHSGGNPDKGTVTISNATSEFHVYSLEWSSSLIKFYVDNNLFYTFNNSSSVPFNHEFFIIMNCAMGGNFGGAVDPNFTNSTFEIDYVRVYK